MNEIVNYHGFRQDGRRLKEIRRIKCTVNEGAHKGVDGSVYYEQGLNKLIVSVIGPVPLPSSYSTPSSSSPFALSHIGNANSTGIVINCNFKVAPFSSQDRRKRGKSDRFCVESGLMISRTFSSVVCDQYSKSQIIINIIVLEGDGSVRSAAINACSIALAIAGISMKDLIVSTTCGLYGEQILYDLTQSEMDGLKGNLLMAINSTDKVVSPVTIDLSTKLKHELFNSLMEESFQACRQTSFYIRNLVREYTSKKYCSIYSK
ncbi:Archeo-eukaryotic exosomal RNase [Cryptosporidium felis]|nr:Archeo-eukaryotic exosomal RNase [Cryptosporidium felis]